MARGQPKENKEDYDSNEVKKWFKELFEFENSKKSEELKL